jgi:hypothetical protein
VESPGSNGEEAPLEHPMKMQDVRINNIDNNLTVDGIVKPS